MIAENTKLKPRILLFWSLSVLKDKNSKLIASSQNFAEINQCQM